MKRDHTHLWIIVGSKMSSKKIIKLKRTPESLPTAWEIRRLNPKSASRDNLIKLNFLSSEAEEKGIFSSRNESINSFTSIVSERDLELTEEGLRHHFDPPSFQQVSSFENRQSLIF